MRMYVLTDKIKLSVTISVCYPHICHPLKKITLPASSKLSQLPPPCWLQKLVSYCPPPMGFACLTGRRTSRRLVTRVFVPPLGFPLLHTRDWWKLHAKIIIGSGGVFVPPPDAASLGEFRGLCWRAPKVKVWCERLVQSICDAIPVSM